MRAMETRAHFRSRFRVEGAFGRELMPSRPVGSCLGVLVLISGLLAWGELEAQEPPQPPPDSVQVVDWLRTVTQPLEARVVEEGRDDILRTVATHVLLGAPHDGDPAGLRVARAALRAGPFEVTVRQGLSAGPGIAGVSIEQTEALTASIAGALRDFDLDARPGAPEGARPDAGDSAGLTVTLWEPMRVGPWVKVLVRVASRESGETIFSGTADVARPDEEWRFMRWGGLWLPTQADSSSGRP
jgi:hypothetical protein